MIFIPYLSKKQHLESQDIPEPGWGIAVLHCWPNMCIAGVWEPKGQNWIWRIARPEPGRVSELSLQPTEELHTWLSMVKPGKDGLCQFIK